MRILLLAPKYMGLCYNIYEELTHQGNEVVYIEDKPLRFDYRFNYHHTFVEKTKNRVYKFLRDRFIDLKKYWNQRLREYDNLFFDVFFVVNGFSYDTSLLLLLRKYNADIKTRLYLWDNLYVYDFNYIIKDFENCFTLDYLDGLRNEKLTFMPAFWTDAINGENPTAVYDVFMVGTNHDDRARIVKKVIKQLHGNHFSYFIKLVDKYRPENRLYTHRIYSTKEYLKLMNQSRCILDTERPSQTGPTVRMIWALALGKKIISTNECLKQMIIYNPEQILIIDRNNPKIDCEFVKSEKYFSPNNYVMGLRIDNWVKTILK